MCCVSELAQCTDRVHCAVIKNWPLNQGIVPVGTARCTLIVCVEHKYSNCRL